MSSIPELYSLQNSLSTGGIEGYHVDKKYYDPIKMKQQRLLSQSNQKSKGSRPVNVSEKTTFIDDVQKKSAKLPGPTSYQPVDVGKSKIKPDTVNHPKRETYIDQITKIAKKRNIPGAGAYGKIQVQQDKSRLRSNLSKAQSPTYAQACMRNSLNAPGVGQYNAYRAVLDHKGNKWAPDPQKITKKSSSVKLPSVGSYNPNPIQYKLFSSISSGNRKASHGFGGKSERFKASKQKKTPYHSVLSQWGMKGKLQKKDILTKISSHPSASRSLYY